MKNIYNLSYLIIISFILTYEPLTIYGTVVDENNNPIEYVFVSSDTDQYYTDSDGKFILLYKLNDEIMFNKIGYSDYLITLKDTNSDLDIILVKENLKLNEITITEMIGNVKSQESSNDIQTLTEYDFKPGDIHFQDVISKIPNIDYAGGSSRPRYFQIRGIGERSQYAGEGGPNYYVATILDDIDLSGIGMPLFLDDINQIEVYQGPQSFSYGHNAMAGLINVKTKDPDKLNDNNLKLKMGTDELLQYSYYRNFKPLLNNKIFTNLFLFKSSQNGYMYNTYLSDYKNNKSETFQKIKFIFKPNESIKSKLTLINSNLDNGYDMWTPDNNTDTTYSNQPGRDSQELFALSLKNQILKDNFKIIHISNFLESNMKHSYDSDWGNDDFWSNDPYNVEYWSYEYYQDELRKRNMSSHEIRFIFNIDDNFKNALGFYTKDLNEKDNANGWILGGEDVALKAKFINTSNAIYNETKYLINNFTLSGNFRFEEVRLDYNSIHYHEEYIDYDYYNPIFDTTYVNTKYDDTLMGSKIALLYTIDNTKNIYLNLSKGFKAGGINQNPRLSDDNRLYKPEYNQNIDFGYKFKNIQTSLNINFFYMNRTDLQVSLSSQQDSNNPNSFYFYTSNASNGNNYGLTLNYKNVSNSNFEVYANVGILKTQIDSYTYFNDESTPIVFEERDAAHAPLYTISYGFTKYYGSLCIGADIHSKDKFYFSDSHNMQSKVYTISDLHINYSINENTNLSLWSKNIFNTTYSNRGFFFGVEPPNYEDKLYLSYGDPFTIGLTINYKF